MDIIDFFRSEQKRLHYALREGVSNLTPDEWHYEVGGTGNNIAFLMLHIVRTEDNVLRYILQDRRSPIWNEGNWHELLKLPSRIQGTGMAVSEAQALRINDPTLFMQYAAQVWQEFEEYLAAINDGGQNFLPGSLRYHHWAKCLPFKHLGRSVSPIPSLISARSRYCSAFRTRKACRYREG